MTPAPSIAYCEGCLLDVNTMIDTAEKGMDRMVSWRSPKTERRTSRIQGQGLFAHETITAGEIVAVKGGSIVDSAGLASLSREIVAAALQIEDDLYIGPQIAAEVEESMMYLNHSCEPNIGVRGQITFVAVSAGK